MLPSHFFYTENTKCLLQVAVLNKIEGDAACNHGFKKQFLELFPLTPRRSEVLDRLRQSALDTFASSPFRSLAFVLSKPFRGVSKLAVFAATFAA
jgi:hypothetical protein